MHKVFCVISWWKWTIHKLLEKKNYTNPFPFLKRICVSSVFSDLCIVYEIDNTRIFFNRQYTNPFPFLKSNFAWSNFAWTVKIDSTQITEIRQLARNEVICLFVYCLFSEWFVYFHQITRNEEAGWSLRSMGWLQSVASIEL